MRTQKGANMLSSYGHEVEERRDVQLSTFPVAGAKKDGPPSTLLRASEKEKFLKLSRKGGIPALQKEADKAALRRRPPRVVAKEEASKPSSPLTRPPVESLPKSSMQNLLVCSPQPAKINGGLVALLQGGNASPAPLCRAPSTAHFKRILLLFQLFLFHP